MTAWAFSPDGKTLLTGGEDDIVRLRSAATGEPLGPPLEHRGPIWAVGFSADGRTALTVAMTNQFNQTPVRLFDITELPDDLPRVAAWVEVATGLAVDETGEIRVLDNADWLERRERLKRLGGPPSPGLYR